MEVWCYMHCNFLLFDWIRRHFFWDAYVHAYYYNWLDLGSQYFISISNNWLWSTLLYKIAGFFESVMSITIFKIDII